MKKKIFLITGGYGFIGRNLSKYFSKKKLLEVYGIGHGFWKKSEWTQYGFKKWKTSEITLDSLLSLNIKPDCIIHCASGSSVPLSIKEPFKDFYKSTKSTTAVLNYIHKTNINCKFIFISSASVYGMTKNILIKENHKLNPISPYGLHKYIEERLIKFYSKKLKIYTCVLRLFSVYGPDLKKQIMWDICNNLNKNKIFSGTGSETRDWVHINDISKLIDLIIKKNLNKFIIINGGTGKKTTVKKLIDMCHKKLGFSKANFTGTKREGDPEHLIANISLARSFGWKPKYDLKIGVSDYVNWFKNKYEKN